MWGHLYKTLRVGCNLAILALNSKILPVKRAYACEELD